jgi:hypothetical protein
VLSEELLASPEELFALELAVVCICEVGAVLESASVESWHFCAFVSL